MTPAFTASASITIHADAARVWEALTNPALVKQYFFGVDVESDWKEGGSIVYRGQWEGKTFEDKGKVVKVEPEKVLVTTYWSSFSGTPDTPEHYQMVTYGLAPVPDGTRLDIVQTNIATAEARDHSAKNWMAVLEGMKKLLEGEHP